MKDIDMPPLPDDDLRKKFNYFLMPNIDESS